MSLKALPQDCRPREKLLARGESALSDAELLAIVLRTGIAGMGVLQMAQSLLDTHGGLRGLLGAGADSLKRTKGLGPAKRAEILAVLALARRALSQQLQQNPVMADANALKDFARLRLGNLRHEVFLVLFLDAKMRLLAAEEMFKGSLTETAVYPREVAVRALHWSAANIVVAHNHPSGDPTPSSADRAMTARLQSALGLLDIRLLDHLVVGAERCVSLQETVGW